VQPPPAPAATQAEPANSLMVSVTEEVVFNEGEAMKTLANGISELLSSANQNNTPKILAAMKGIVMIVRKHLDDAEEYEKSQKNTWTPEQTEKFSDLQNDISDKLTSLVVVAKAHISGKSEGSHEDSIRKMETLSMNLSNALVRLLGGMLRGNPKNKEMDLSELPVFLDKQTNVIVHAIQTLMLVLKTPGTSASGFVSAIDALVSAVTLLKNVSSYACRQKGAFENRDYLESLIRALTEEISKMLNFREMINSGHKSNNQLIAGSAFEIAKLTKEIVVMFNNS